MSVVLFQAEDGIRHAHELLEFRRVLFRSSLPDRSPALLAIGRKREQAFSVCEQARMMASTLSHSVSSMAHLLSANLSRNPRCLRARSEEHTSELQSLMRISYAVFCLKKKKKQKKINKHTHIHKSQTYKRTKKENSKTTRYK